MLCNPYWRSSGKSLAECKIREERGWTVGWLLKWMPCCPCVFAPMKSFPRSDGELINVLINCLIKTTGQISLWHFTEWHTIWVIREKSTSKKRGHPFAKKTLRRAVNCGLQQKLMEMTIKNQQITSSETTTLMKDALKPRFSVLDKWCRREKKSRCIMRGLQRLSWQAQY